MPKESRKLYKIGDLTALLGITHRSIRYYDEYGLLPHVKRSDGKVRLFDQDDITLIKKIRKMQREQGLTLSQIRTELFGARVDAVGSEVVVITDSSSGLPKAQTDGLPLVVLPLDIVIDDEIFKDSIDPIPSKAWESVGSGKNTIQVKPIAEQDFVNLFLQLADQGFKHAFSIHGSANWSPMYQNAVHAAAKVEHKITVIPVDSGVIGAGVGLLARAIAQTVQAGDSFEEINIAISKHLQMVTDLVTTNSLSFLSQGEKLDRLNQNQLSVLNKLFEFKPILLFKDGELETIDICKTKTNAVKTIISKLENEFIARGRYFREIAVVYNYLYGEALALINHIKESFPNTPVYLIEGSASVAHDIGYEYFGVSVL